MISNELQKYEKKKQIKEKPITKLDWWFTTLFHFSPKHIKRFQGQYTFFGGRVSQKTNAEHKVGKKGNVSQKQQHQSKRLICQNRTAIRI